MKKTKLNNAKEEFLEEMLREVKSLKDVAKEELPLLAKEYIYANKVQIWMLLGVSMLLLIMAAAGTAYLVLGEFEKYDNAISAILCIVLTTGAAGLVLLFFSISELLDFYLQPRRMAIIAITSLK